MPSEERRHKERLLVRSYRDQLTALEAAQQDGLADRSLQQRLDEAETLYRKCELPESTVAEVDGQLVAQLSSELSRSVRNASAGPITFQPADFAARLSAAVNQEDSLTPNAWAGLGRLTANLLGPCPGLQLLNGTLGVPNAPPAERKQRAPRARPNALSAAVAPDKVVEVAEPGATPQQINRLESTLKALYRRLGKPISFFEFAYHPTDFGVTVENIFHASILVKMKKARLYHKHGLPVLEPVSGGAAPAGGDAAGDKHQMLFRIDHESWRRIVKEFGIKKALIPPAEGRQ
ncbi:non-structural maintenance of chromosomes element 4 homolog A-like [Amphibalanus amphitrite]|uniref:non-structural maintenance of chromosomes element 4 homolog A-like n=1 Tax=Amphibalanus amphitrite TaxID=1232801 RepID=UPI001C8FEEE9|nr:non-structural maintenance of chromosomes element 4 homolog A-like [Amphibalanus amphitrite]XP_043197162.1 non-structural maintenance of chromosomes element 4 homolog A-like [Amphibalanus amphitrite]